MVRWFILIDCTVNYVLFSARRENPLIRHDTGVCLLLSCNTNQTRKKRKPLLHMFKRKAPRSRAEETESIKKRKERKRRNSHINCHSTSFFLSAALAATEQLSIEFIMLIMQKPPSLGQPPVACSTLSALPFPLTDWRCGWPTNLHYYPPRRAL